MPLILIAVEVDGPKRQSAGHPCERFSRRSPKAGPRPSGGRRCSSVSRATLELAGRLAKEI